MRAKPRQLSNIPIWAKTSLALAITLALLRILAGAMGLAQAPNTNGWQQFVLRLQPNGALLSLLLAGSLWSSGQLGGRRRLRLSQLLAACGLAIGLLTLVQYVTPSIGIDQLIMRGWPDGEADDFPGRMTISGSIAFILLSLAVLRFPGSRGKTEARFAALTAFGLCAFNLVGNLYGQGNIFGPARHFTMSLTTSVQCILLTLPLFLLRPRKFLRRPFTVGTAGGLLVRRLLPAAILFIPSVGWLKLQAEILGFYDSHFGLALFVIVNLLTFTILIGHTAEAVDATERKRRYALSKLQEAEFHFHAIVESLPQLIWTCLPSGECDFVNQRWLAYTGTTLATQVGTGWTMSVHPEDLHTISTLWRTTVVTGMPMDSEYRLRAHDGSYRWFRALANPIRDEHGNITHWFGSSTDIEERKRAELDIVRLNAHLEQRVLDRTAELNATRARLESIFQASTEVSMIVADMDGTVELFNSGAERLLGYKASEVVGQISAIHFHCPKELAERQANLSARLGHQVTLLELVQDAAQNYDAADRQWTYVRRDGSTLTVHLALTGIPDHTGTVRAFLGVAVDITQRLALEHTLLERNQELNAARLEAEAANRAKSNFLANMSHEIRTPMNGVIGMAGLLLDSGLSAEQKLFCETIHTSGESLLNLINDILDFSKIEAGKMQMEEIEFDLRTVLETTLQMLAPRAAEKNLELTCLLDPSLPQMVFGDPGRLRQILLNLAGNAVKFTAEGAVTIKATPCPQRPDRVRISVEDTGIGIPLDRQASLFQPFTQVDASVTRKFGGTGLGLAITKELIALMDGEIGVTSNEGQGSTFWITPKLLHKQSKNVHPTPPVRASLAGVSVLVVDDAESSRLLLSNLLLGWGCLFEATSNPNSALERMRAAARAGSPYAVALIDYRLPDLLGVDLGLLIKADPLLKDTILVLMSSVAEKGHAKQSEIVGFAAFLNKPIRQDDLFAAMETALGYRTEPTNAKALLTQHSLNENRQWRGRILLAEDNRTNQLVAVAIVRKLGYWIDTVSNGLEALQALKKIPYDLVLMDCQMPEMDGLTATREIRAGTAGAAPQKLPIIAMTAFALLGDRELCLAAGMTDYITKPVDAKLLGEKLDFYLAQCSSETTIQLEPDIARN